MPGVDARAGAPARFDRSSKRCRTVSKSTSPRWRATYSSPASSPVSRISDEDDARHLLWIGEREAALGNALADDRRDVRRDPLDLLVAQLLAHDRVVVGEPDLMSATHEVASAPPCSAAIVVK